MTLAVVFDMSVALTCGSGMPTICLYCKPAIDTRLEGIKHAGVGQAHAIKQRCCSPDSGTQQQVLAR